MNPIIGKVGCGVVMGMAMAVISFETVEVFPKTHN